MKVSAALLVAFTCAGCMAACGGSEDATPRTPQPAPEVVLTPEEKQVWAPLPPDRTAVPVLLYHGIGSEGDFANASDYDYGVSVEAFARQMTLIEHAGYQTIDLATFLRFVQGDPVELPARPLLLTFDDARANSWTGSDGILRELGFNAVMFVDVGSVDDADDPEYLTWEELETMQAGGRWALQNHSGHGHKQVRYGPRQDEFGPYYAYKLKTEDFGEWQERVRGDIAWGQETLAAHIPAYRALAFAPPYGAYGQDGTNDERIPDDLLGWLTERYDAVFTQDVNSRAQTGSTQPLGRTQITRAVSDDDLFDRLLSGEN